MCCKLSVTSRSQTELRLLILRIKIISNSLQRIKIGAQHSLRVKCKLMYPGAQHHLSKLNVCWCTHYPQKHLIRGMGDGLGFVIHFPHLSLWMWHPCRERDGNTETVISTQNFSYPVEQQGAPHSLIYLLSHCTVLQQEHFPSSSSHVCKGWKMQGEEKTSRQSLWFCRRVVSPQLNVPEAQHYRCSKSHILYTCNWTCTRRFCRLTTSEKTCCMARGCKAVSCSEDSCGSVALGAVFWPTITSREEEKFCRRTALRNCMMLTRQRDAY